MGRGREPAVSDRVVPDIAIGRLQALFEAAGWNAIVVKYGRRLRQLFAQGKGDVLRRRLDEMTNEEYQRLLRSPNGEVRERLCGSASDARSDALLSDLSDVEVKALIRDLGGHDLADLIDAFDQADAVNDRPTVIFAYTIKAWSLPTEGHPGNHSALLSSDQWEEPGYALGASASDPWALFPAGSAEEELCRRAASAANPVRRRRTRASECSTSARPIASRDVVHPGRVWSFLRGPCVE